MGIFGKPDIEKMERKRNVEGLVKALNHRDLDVRAGAARALGRIGDRRAVEPLCKTLQQHDPHRIPSKDWRAYQDAYVQICRCAAEALRAMNSSTVEALAWELGDFGEEECVRAFKDLANLGKEGDEKAIATLIKYCGKVPTDIAADVLAELGEPAFRQLAKTLGKDSREVPGKDTVVEMVKRIGGAWAVPPLIEALKDSWWGVRKDAAEALGRIGNEQAIELLLQVAISDPYKEERHVSDQNVDEAGYYSESRIEYEYPVSDAARSAVRYISQRMIDKMTKERDVEALIKVLTDDRWRRSRVDVDIKPWAAEALGEVGDERAVEPLIDTVEWYGTYVENTYYTAKDSTLVRRKAAEALEKIRTRMRPSSKPIKEWFEYKVETSDSLTLWVWKCRKCSSHVFSYTEKLEPDAERLREGLLLHVLRHETKGETA
ncbi:HEAT repeat domain-containing protein [Candidatus Hecatella orcuttiae]|jgi:HEAT repeat protein|uniref:HEAT repeat domain-containing protein n=1 Tax=Candidatus Hecatella orcuttiae TaxID=1935119 RepID=UPI0028681856|nr:HEAT repeat domain-containing protein [Candidatus Hecatella orcuttiae]